jgi:CHAT domain-containing protein
VSDPTSAPPDWLDAVHALWERSALPATINMRGRPQRLGDAAIRRAEQWEHGARGRGWRQELLAEVFANVVRELVATGGDPPASQEQRALALAVVRGQAPGDIVGRTDAVARRLAPALDRQLARAAGDQERADFRVMLAGVATLLMLARVEVLRLRKELPPAVPDAPDIVGETLQAAFDCPLDQPARREALLCDALRVGLTGGPPPPAIPVLEALVYGGLPLAPTTLRRCVAVMTALEGQAPFYAELGIDAATARERDDMLATVFGTIAIRADEASLGSELSEPIATALVAMLARDLSSNVRLSVGLAAAGIWVRIGRLDRADMIVAELRGSVPGATAELRTAEMGARIRSRCGDREGATEMLLRVLGRPEDSMDPAYRRQAILTLISSWPVALDPEAGDPRPGRAGIEPWIEEAQRLGEADASSAANAGRAELMTALFSLGLYRLGAEIHQSIDFESWARSAGFRESIKEWSDRQAARGAGLAQPAVPGDAGKDSVEVGTEHRFAEGASQAESDATVALDRGDPMSAFLYLAIAAQQHRRAGELHASVNAFARAFALLESDLRYIPYPELVVSRLADWSDRYPVAAITALDAGDPARALSFAETGRARAVAGQLGVVGAPPTETITRADWERFRAGWRRLAAQAANQLYDAGASPPPRARPGESDGPGPWPVAKSGDLATLAADVAELRRRFAGAGAPPAALSPVIAPPSTSDYVARLAAADRPTAVLYSVIAENQLRFVRITAGGVTEIHCETEAMDAVLEAVGAFSDQIRAASDVESAVRRLLPVMLMGTGPHLEPVLHQAIDGLDGGRLIWIPQGMLAALPIHALPLAGRHVCDSVAVIVAESLASASTERLSATPLRPVRPVAIRGRPSADAPTDGAAALLPAGTSEHLVASPEELERALTDRPRIGADRRHGATVIHLDCHGVFRWRDPLSSYLKLGGNFDLSVGELFDSIQIDRNAVVVLDSCDSGTIAQTDLNEGIGIPAGLLAAGASTVIGAGWPVARLASVSICRQVIKSLLAGADSPEAIRRATCWLRDVTVGDVLAELRAIGHPLADALGEPDPQFLAQRLADPWLWAAFMHWGAVWRAEVREAPTGGITSTAA